MTEEEERAGIGGTVLPGSSETPGGRAGIGGTHLPSGMSPEPSNTGSDLAWYMARRRQATMFVAVKGVDR